MSLLLPLFVAVPLLASGLLVLVRAPRPVRRATLLATCAASAIAGFALLGVTVHRDVIVHRLGGWDASLAIPFAADTLSALMVALTSFTTLVTVLFAARVRVADEPYFCPLVLAVVAGVNGALLTADLFNLFVFIEIMLVPSYALIVLAHRGMGRRMQVTATRIYVTVNLLTSSVFLMGVALIYASLGTVNLGALAGRAFETPASTVGSCLLLLALAVKAAVVPMHGWLSRTYPFMSPTVSALFSGLHTKVAVYAIFRIYAVLFGADHRLQTVALVVFCVSMAIGVLGAVGEKNARAILSFHMVSQIGYILMGFALLTPAGVAPLLPGAQRDREGVPVLVDGRRRDDVRAARPGRGARARAAGAGDRGRLLRRRDVAGRAAAVLRVRREVRGHRGLVRGRAGGRRGRRARREPVHAAVDAEDLGRDVPGRGSARRRRGRPAHPPRAHRPRGDPRGGVRRARPGGRAAAPALPGRRPRPARPVGLRGGGDGTMTWLTWPARLAAFACWFLGEVVRSNARVIADIVTGGQRVRPLIARYDTRARSEFELALFSVLVSLTPGTLVLATDHDATDEPYSLYVHTLYDDADELRASLADLDRRMRRAVRRKGAGS